MRAAGATSAEAWLVAPFAKVAIVGSLFDRLPSDAAVTLVTRWRAEEVANGVSDLEVWDLCQDRPGTRMLLEPTLHAKYFRFDDQAFVGSVNLTAAAFGWRSPSNLEILAPYVPQPDFEHKLLRESIRPTESLRNAVAEAAAALAPDATTGEEDEPDIDNQDDGAHPWLPETRHPQDLYLAYAGDSDLLGRATRAATRRDLMALDLPRGLSDAEFQAVVGARLLSVKAVTAIDDFLSETRRFGEVRDRLIILWGLDREDATVVWQTLMRWLLHFLPHRYAATRPRHSEGLRRVEA